MKLTFDIDFISLAWKLLWLSGGIVIGYKLKTQIQTAIISFKKQLASSIAPKV